MSQKMKKPSTKPSSTTTTTSASSTAASQHPMAPPSSAQSVSSSASSVSSASESMETALSPSRRSRLHEKNSLMNLNDRLACYIERVRFLEQENSRLSLELTNFQETAHREVSGLKSIYEHELADARKLLDETARDKAKVEIDAKRYWEENEQLRVKLNRRTKELSELEKSARASESRCVELTASYNTLCSERKKLQEELSEVEKEADALRGSAEAMRKDLEQETLLRVDLENNVQSLREELTFKDQIHSQELSESKLRRQSEISEIDGFLMEQYETKLQQTLQDLRDQYDQQLRHNRDELGERFEGRIQDLEDRLGEERARHEAEKATLSDALDRMRNEMAVQLKDYQDLMDIKVSLDMEIAAYDKLLSSEETRLNMAPSVSSSSSAGVFSSSASRIFRTPSLKRKRNTLDESLDYSVLASAKGDIEVTEADPEGRFVRITNRSKQEYRLDGWQLVRRPTDAPEVCFRFPKSAKIEGNGMVTVWASVANRKPDPPTDLVMKSAALWTVTDTMATVLVNGEGEEVALLERHRTVRAPKDKYFHEESGGRLAVSSKSSPKGTTNGVSRNDEQCCVM